jgi:hypothetical protein
MKRTGPLLVFVLMTVMLSLFGALCGCSSTFPSAVTSAGSQAVTAGAGDAVLAEAFVERAGNLEVEGDGTVVSILADDTEGERHQRFIVRLASGQTLLVAHNIDIAPRVTSLQVGDQVAFKGVYEWNDQGGLIHWTHRDPSGSHVAGWIKHDDHTYQ